MMAVEVGGVKYICLVMLFLLPVEIYTYIIQEDFLETGIVELYLWILRFISTYGYVLW